MQQHGTLLRFWGFSKYLIRANKVPGDWQCFNTANHCGIVALTMFWISFVPSWGSALPHKSDLPPHIYSAHKQWLSSLYPYLPHDVPRTLETPLYLRQLDSQSRNVAIDSILINSFDCCFLASQDCRALSCSLKAFGETYNQENSKRKLLFNISFRARQNLVINPLWATHNFSAHEFHFAGCQIG